MKTKFVVWTACLVMVSNIHAQVWMQGLCRLTDSMDNSGTVVVFNAASPTALTDSVVTNVQGAYQIMIRPGIYSISFRHEGYFPVQLNAISCFSPRTLEDQHLIVREGIPISGSVSGILAATTYLVEGDLIIEMGDTLRINPGTRFYFDGNYRFIANGDLQAIGSQADSIQFLPSPRMTTWGGICIGDMEHGGSGNFQFKYCHIEGSNFYGIKTDRLLGFTQVFISNCTVVNNMSYGIGLYNTDCLVEGNMQVLDTRIENNLGGIDVWGSASIKGCSIMYNSIFGIQKQTSSTIDIQNCIVANNDDGAGASIGIILANHDDHQNTIRNCVIKGNPTGISLQSGSGSGNFSIINTIIDSNHDGIWLNLVGEAAVSAAYCDFYNNDYNFSGPSPAYLGEKIMTNVNGDSCDAYLNIFENPLFVDAENDDFHLQATSPCINAGNPNSSPDPDGTVADIGAFYFNTGPAPAISLSTQYMYFSDTFLDDSTTIPLTITNMGDEDLVLHNISATSPSFHTEWDAADTLINPGSSIEVNITFTPHVFDIHTGTVSIRSNDRSAYVGVSGMCVPQGVNYATSLVLAGGGTEPTNWNYFINNTSPSATDAFSKLAYGRYYTGTRLFYMNPVGWQDLNGDGLDDGIIDSDALNPQSVKSALMGLVDDPNSAYPNVISLSGHGHVGEFDINGNAEDNISADSLSLWLDQVNLDQLSPLVVVLEACFSGSFVPVLAGDNRIVIAACREDQFADYLNGECFSTNFWEEIWYGNNVWDAFYSAYQRAQVYLNGQEPQLDADGNGIPNEASDEAMARNVYLGGELMHGALLPEIREYPAEIFMESGQVNVTARCNGIMDRVWFRIFPANYSGMPPVNELPLVQMNHMGSFNYSGSYVNDGFLQSGSTYVVQIDALDDIYNHAIPKIIPLIMQPAAIEGSPFLPLEFQLSQNYPNPFNPSTTIRYGLAEDSNVSLVIYDVRGQVLQILESGHQPAGWYNVVWNGQTADGRPISTGIYFARLVAGDYSQVIKMLYLK